VLTEQVTSADNTQNRDGTEKRTANLRTFQKGISGNPGGRPKVNPEVRSLALKNSKRAMERLVQLIESDDERVSFMAAKEVLDRAFGKTLPAKDENDNKSVTINIVRYGDSIKPAQQLDAETVSSRTLALS